MADYLFDGAESRVDRPRPDRGLLDAALPLYKSDLGRGAHVVSAVHDKRVEPPFVMPRFMGRHLRFGQCRKVAVSDPLLAVGQILEGREDLRHAPFAKIVSHLL